MENIQKYELVQNGKKYILSTQVDGEFVTLKCTESEVLNPPFFIGNFSLSHLKQLNQLFNNCYTTIEAQELINQTIDNKKVSVEQEGNLLNLVLYLSKEDESEENTITISLNSETVIYKKPLVYESFIQSESPTKRLSEQIISTKTETQEETIYSPVKRLPDTSINLPPKETTIAPETITETIYSPVKRLPDISVNLPPKETTIAPETITETVYTPVKRLPDISVNLPPKEPTISPETISETIYSPVKRLPDISVNLPPKETTVAPETITETVYTPVKRLPDTSVNLPPKETTIAPEIINEIVYSPAKRLPDTSINLPPKETKINPEIIESKEYVENIGNTPKYDEYQNYDNLINENQINTEIFSTTVNSTTETEALASTNQNFQTQNESQKESEDYSKYFQTHNEKQNENEDYSKYFQTNTQKETNYELNSPATNVELTNITPVVEESKFDYNFSSPEREQIQYVIPGSSSTPQITYSSAPSHKNNASLEQQKIIETTKSMKTQQYRPVQSTNIDINIYNQKITDLQNETNKIRGEHETLKNESKKLTEEVGGLKRQIQIILEENSILRKKSGSQPSSIQIHEISILKQENEKLKKQLEQYIATQSTFDQYKILKEEEIKYLKLQITELEKNQKKLDEIIAINKKENNELKMKNQQLLKNMNISDKQKYLIFQHQSKNADSLKNQILTIQDTHLEIVKGDIIKSSEELELLSRKICKNYKKVVLDLLYKATIDSDKASEFHKKCDWANRTLVLIRSGNGKRFGGYTTCSWNGDSIEKKDENAFVFSLDKMKIYDIIPGEDAIGCYPKYGPVFLGCQIRIFDNFFTTGGTTFERGVNYNTEEDYELSGGMNKYEVKDIEVYSVQLE